MRAASRRVRSSRDNAPDAHSRACWRRANPRRSPTCIRNAQRLLRPLAVVNPFAERLTFLDDRTRTRRDHAKYLTLIDAIALLHQHQREIRTLERAGKRIEYIEVQLADIALANALAHEVLGRLLDELPPQTRRVLGMIEGLVEDQAKRRVLSRSDVRFTRRELRAACGMSDAAIRVHLAGVQSSLTTHGVPSLAGESAPAPNPPRVSEPDVSLTAAVPIEPAPTLLAADEKAAKKDTGHCAAGAYRGRSAAVAAAGAAGEDR